MSRTGSWMFPNSFMTGMGNQRLNKGFLVNIHVIGHLLVSKANSRTLIYRMGLAACIIDVFLMCFEAVILDWHISPYSVPTEVALFVNIGSGVVFTLHRLLLQALVLVFIRKSYSNFRFWLFAILLTLPNFILNINTLRFNIATPFYSYTSVLNSYTESAQGSFIVPNTTNIYDAFQMMIFFFNALPVALRQVEITGRWRMVMFDRVWSLALFMLLQCYIFSVSLVSSVAYPRPDIDWTVQGNARDK